MDEETVGTGWQQAYEAGQAEAALKAGSQILKVPGRRDPVPYAVLPDGFHAQGLEDFIGDRTDRAGTATFQDVASFLAYVDRFRTEQTLLFGSEQGGTVTAHLDYHEGGAKGSAGTCLHRATLALAFTLEWRAWTGINGKPLPQVQFAEFLEDHRLEIAEPDGAKVLEAARSLESTKSVDFKSAVNLSNGLVTLKYEEKERGAGNVTVPSEFLLGLSPYESWGEPLPKHALRAMLRYRIADQKLSFIVRLIRPEDVLRAAFAGVLAAVEAGCGLKPLLGSVTGIGG